MLLTVLIIIYLILIVLVVVLYWSRKRRNYWRRVLFDVSPCPFGQEIYTVQSISGTRLSQGILSYSLYGNYSKYAPKLYYNLDRISKLMPSWQARVYLAANIPQEVQNEILAHGAEIYVMGPEAPKGHEGALWRFLPAAEDKPFLTLDADDEFNERIVSDISAWLKSGKRFGNFNKFKFFLPMTASTWGSRDRAVPDMEQRINKYCEHWFGFDEAFLHNEIWPIMQKDYWATFGVPLKGLVITGIVILVLLMIYSLYLASSLQ